jgi:hypothetical protein
MRRGLACAAAALAAAAAPAAAQGSFLDAAEGAAHVAVGVVREPAALDRHGFAASFQVERALSGGAAPGAALRIAWEQFDPSRPVRFAGGARWLLALDAFPGGSLWLERIPDALRGAPVFVVAARSSAALPDPDTASLEVLGAWLALDAEGRRGAAGARALAALVERGSAPLASGAAARLDRLPDLRALATGETAAALGRALADPARPVELRRAIAELAARRRLDALRPALETVAAAESPVRADAITALARLDGGIGAERAQALLADTDPRVRAAAVRSTPGLDPAELARLARSDRAPEVRAAAVGALADRSDPRGPEAAAAALADPDLEVRREALRAIMLHGEASAPVLRERAFAGSDEAAAAATAALGLTGEAGRGALEEIAARHPDEKIRKAAHFALTRSAEEKH